MNHESRRMPRVAAEWCWWTALLAALAASLWVSVTGNARGSSEHPRRHDAVQSVDDGAPRGAAGSVGFPRLLTDSDFSRTRTSRDESGQTSVSGWCAGAPIESRLIDLDEAILPQLSKATWQPRHPIVSSHSLCGALITRDGTLALVHGDEIVRGVDNRIELPPATRIAVHLCRVPPALRDRSTIFGALRDLRFADSMIDAKASFAAGVTAQFEFGTDQLWVPLGLALGGSLHVDVRPKAGGPSLASRDFEFSARDRFVEVDMACSAQFVDLARATIRLCFRDAALSGTMDLTMEPVGGGRRRQIRLERKSQDEEVQVVVDDLERREFDLSLEPGSGKPTIPLDRLVADRPEVLLTTGVHCGNGVRARLRGVPAKSAGPCTLILRDSAGRSIGAGYSEAGSAVVNLGDLAGGDYTAQAFCVSAYLASPITTLHLGANDRIDLDLDLRPATAVAFEEVADPLESLRLECREAGGVCSPVVVGRRSRRCLLPQGIHDVVSGAQTHRVVLGPEREYAYHPPR